MSKDRTQPQSPSPRPTPTNPTPKPLSTIRRRDVRTAVAKNRGW